MPLLQWPVEPFGGEINSQGIPSSLLFLSMTYDTWFCPHTASCLLPCTRGREILTGSPLGPTSTSTPTPVSVLPLYRWILEKWDTALAWYSRVSDIPSPPQWGSQMGSFHTSYIYRVYTHRANSLSLSEASKKKRGEGKELGRVRDSRA